MMRERPQLGTLDVGLADANIARPSQTHSPSEHHRSPSDLLRSRSELVESPLSASVSIPLSPRPAAATIRHNTSHNTTLRRSATGPHPHFPTLNEQKPFPVVLSWTRPDTPTDDRGLEDDTASSLRRKSIRRAEIVRSVHAGVPAARLGVVPPGGSLKRASRLGG